MNNDKKAPAAPLRLGHPSEHVKAALMHLGMAHAHLQGVDPVAQDHIMLLVADVEFDHGGAASANQAIVETRRTIGIFKG